MGLCLPMRPKLIKSSGHISRDCVIYLILFFLAYLSNGLVIRGHVVAIIISGFLNLENGYNKIKILRYGVP